MPVHLKSLCCVLLVLATGARGSLAQEPTKTARNPLSLELRQLTMATRSEGPILVGLMLDPYVKVPLEGTLELEFYDAGTRVLALHIPDIFMQGNRYETTLILPPMPRVNARGLDFNAVFATETDRYLLSDRTASTNEQAGTLLITPSYQRGMTIGMICGKQERERSLNQRFVTKHLGFDKYMQVPRSRYESDSQRIQRMQTTRSPAGSACTSWAIEADRLPANSLAMCAFDVLLLSDGGLAALTNQQIDAIRNWVRAGGSVCVCTDGELERRHSAFLTDLCSEREEEVSFAVNPNGEMVGLDDDEAVLAEYGLGSVVVFGPTADLETAHLRYTDEYEKQEQQIAADIIREVNASTPLPDSVKLRIQRSLEEWRDTDGSELFKDRGEEQRKIEEAAALLWHVRSDRIGHGSWLLQRSGSTSQWNGFQYNTRQLGPVNHYGAGLVSQLMPTGVKMVPITLVGSILLGYIFLVGPGDYFLLGLLKMRRYTWVVFPIVTVVFTAGLVMLSNYYMSATETGGEIEICDVASDQVVRRSRIGLEFYGNRRETEFQRDNSLYTPVDVTQQSDFGLILTTRPTPRPASDRQDTTDDNLYYFGRVGSKYSTHRVVPQWAPRLNRSLEIVADEPAPNCGFDWNAPGDLLTTEGRFELGEAVRGWKSDAGVCVYNRGQRYEVRRPPTFSRNSELMVDATGRVRQYGFVTEIGQAGAGLLAYVSRIAPHGGGSFEDLTMIDAMNRSEWLLEISWMEDNKQIVYRKRYLIDPPEAGRTP